MGKVRQFCKEEQFTLIREWRRSGLSKSEWCEKHSITVYDFKNWIAEVSEPHIKESPEWISVIPSTEISAQSDKSAIEVQIGNCTIKIREDFNSAVFFAICRELRRL